MVGIRRLGAILCGVKKSTDDAIAFIAESGKGSVGSTGRRRASGLVAPFIFLRACSMSEKVSSVRTMPDTPGPLD